MDDRNIVTIDLGTSKIAVGIAHISGGNIDVTYYKETPSGGIKRGAVFNESNVAGALKRALEEAKKTTGMEVFSAAVSMPRCYISQYRSQAKMALDPTMAISEEEIEALENIAKNECPVNESNGETVYCAIAQSFSDGEEFQIPLEEIIGLERESIEGNYKIFAGNKTSLTRIASAFSKAGVTDSKKYFTAVASAKAVLSTSQIESGVALVEIGGGVTSVSVYKNGILCYYGSIPFGGKSITNDIITCCNIGEHLAENLKKGYGICLPGNLLNYDEKVLRISGKTMGTDKEISVKFLSEIITARMNEIADAVLYMIQESGLADDLVSGIVLTGGGAELGNVCNLFKEKSGLPVSIGRHGRNLSINNEATGILETAGAATAGMILLAAEDFHVDCTRIATVTPETVIIEEEPATTEDEPGTVFDNGAKEDESVEDPGETETQVKGKERGRIIPAWEKLIFGRNGDTPEQKEQRELEKKRKEEEKQRKAEEKRRKEEEAKRKKAEKQQKEENKKEKDFIDNIFGYEEA
ncbi:MAG: cell division protein FtsA [Bacteroidales bacterium]|nr:cell division protein FtsA [Bacteroidales bacterium]